MLQKKICLLGGPEVGKTSLVARLVRNFFTDRHLATIGVRIDKRVLDLESGPLLCVVWDLAGADEFSGAAVSYLRGAAGYLLAVDGTRRETLAEARRLQAAAERILGPVPFIAVLNKADLKPAWRIEVAERAALAEAGWTFYEASAKTGQGVEESFRGLAELILRHRPAALSPH
jgi:small GTP-binding protein